MAKEISFEDKGVQKFLKKISKKVDEVSKNKKSFVNVLGPVVFRDVIDHFEKEQGPNGSWAPWSKAYEEKLQRRGFGGNQILQFNGRMRNTFLPTSWRKQSQGIAWFNPAKTKSGFPYAFHHDEGRSSKSGPREFMWLSDKAMDELSSIMLNHITE